MRQGWLESASTLNGSSGSPEREETRLGHCCGCIRVNDKTLFSEIEETLDRIIETVKSLKLESSYERHRGKA